MPSFQDSAVIFFLALLLFGPKKLPELARYVGKLMGEFRRASSEFRLQMEDEFRLAEQAEQQKKIAAMEAAAPLPPVVTQQIPEPEHPHMPPAMEETPEVAVEPANVAAETVEAEPLPIAASGELNMMPPPTGLPTGRSNSLGGMFDSIPQAPDPTVVAAREMVAPQETEAHPNV